MKIVYETDFKEFINDWRLFSLETVRDIRKNNKWVPNKITIPNKWNRSANYRVRKFKSGFYMVVEDGDKMYRYLLDKHIMKLMDNHTHSSYIK